MSKKELAFQKELIDAAKAQGGRGVKLSHKFSVGVADLLVSIPNSPMVLWEAKQLDDAPGEFSRKTGITPIQQAWLKSFNDTQFDLIACQIVYIKHKGNERAILWPADMDTITSRYEEFGIWVARTTAPPKWDVRRLREMMPAVLLAHRLKKS